MDLKLQNHTILSVEQNILNNFLANLGYNTIYKLPKIN